MECIRELLYQFGVYFSLITSRETLLARKIENDRISTMFKEMDKERDLNIKQAVKSYCDFRKVMKFGMKSDEMVKQIKDHLPSFYVEKVKLGSQVILNYSVRRIRVYYDPEDDMCVDITQG